MDHCLLSVLLMANLRIVLVAQGNEGGKEGGMLLAGLGEREVGWEGKGDRRRDVGMEGSGREGQEEKRRTVLDFSSIV